jgi:hypothetical protein
MHQIRSWDSRKSILNGIDVADRGETNHLKGGKQDIIQRRNKQ